jgi:uncharacterized protein YggU (UPF0235/DUF167 family)
MAAGVPEEHACVQENKAGMKSCLRVSGEYLFLDIRAVPGASKSCLGELSEGRLKVRIAAAPEDGKAFARNSS